MNDLTIKTIQRLNLNMNYSLINSSTYVENQTNFYIQREMVKFLKYYENRKIIFVLDYKDDLLSVITYRFLKNIQSAYYKFPLFLYGKIKETKDYINKKDLKISKFKLKYIIKKHRVVIVRPFNPLYQVVNSNITFKDFGVEVYEPLKQFTPDQIFTTQVFYGIGYLKKDPIKKENKNIEKFSKFCYFKDNEYDQFDFIPKQFSKEVYEIKVIDLNMSEKRILLELNNVEQLKGLVFYKGDIKNIPQGFEQYLKYKVNIPNPEINFIPSVVYNELIGGKTDD